MGRSLAIDDDSGILLIGTEDGSVLSRSLSNSAILPDLRTSDGSQNAGIYAITVDDHGTIWAAGNCTIYYKPMGNVDWSDYDYCQSLNIETPSDILIIGDSVYLATTSSGVHIINYITASSSGSV